jgi:hypothetical protein
MARNNTIINEKLFEAKLKTGASHQVGNWSFPSRIFPYTNETVLSCQFFFVGVAK